MSVGQFEDFLVFHTKEVSPATDLVVEVQTADGASVTVAVTDVRIGGDRLVTRCPCHAIGDDRRLGGVVR